MTRGRQTTMNMLSVIHFHRPAGRPARRSDTLYSLCWLDDATRVGCSVQLFAVTWYVRSTTHAQIVQRVYKGLMHPPGQVYLSPAQAHLLVDQKVVDLCAPHNTHGGYSEFRLPTVAAVARRFGTQSSFETMLRNRPEFRASVPGSPVQPTYQVGRILHV